MGDGYVVRSGNGDTSSHTNGNILSLPWLNRQGIVLTLAAIIGGSNSRIARHDRRDMHGLRIEGLLCIERNRAGRFIGVRAGQRDYLAVPAPVDLLVGGKGHLFAHRNGVGGAAGAGLAGGDRDARVRLGGRQHGQRAAECLDGISGAVDNASLRPIAGVVAPDAEHGTGGIADLTARECGLVKATCLFGRALRISLAEHPVVVPVGVDQLEALAGKRCGRHRAIARPAVRPIADNDIGVKRTG